MNTLIVFIFLMIPLATLGADSPIIGIFGDSHGKIDAVHEVLSQMRARGVTHIIGMGDFVSFKFPEDAAKFDLKEGPRQLNQILSLITPVSGVPRDRVWLMPGNWEHESIYEPREMNDIMRNFGTLVFENYDSHGFIEIGGKRIMVSHFPQYPVPEHLLPPVKFRKRMSKMTLSLESGQAKYIMHAEPQAFVMDTINRGVFPPQDVAFAVFAHTHIGGAFRDATSGKLIVNSGVLDDRTKSPSEPRGYIIYNTETDTLEFLDFETQQTTRIIDLKPSNKTTRIACGRFL